MKMGASRIDKKEIAALAEAKLTVKQIAKKLRISDKIVTLWMPEAVKKREAAAAKAAK